MASNFDAADGRPKIEKDALLDRLKDLHDAHTAKAAATAKAGPWVHTSGSGPVIVDPHKG